VYVAFRSLTSRSFLQMVEDRQHFIRLVVFAGKHMRLEYNGPAIEELEKTENPRVVVAFGPFDYPFLNDVEGWGSASFSKRDIAHVCVFHSAEDWHQNADFFPAMQACRAFLGRRINVTSYGFSMGGYGALLGAKTLDAERTVAVSPQSSIDPAVVRFERRYGPQWAAMDGWKHDLSKQMNDSQTYYLVLFDPLHNQDRKHESRLPKPANYTRCLLHGVGHAGLQALVEMKIQETLFDVLQGTADASDLRNAFRARRELGFRYLRKLGTRLHERKHPKAAAVFEIAKRNGFRRLIKKWRPYYD
jgi:hypothetical protein